MSYAALGSVARQLGALYEGGSAAGQSDRELIERFNARREPADQIAFAALVSRHGPMVLGTCRQFLGDHHHAEDAFQAVFLVLARQARSIRDPELLGPWLYGVARRTAQTYRGRIARHRRTEEERAIRQRTSRPAQAADGAMLEREQAEALHREIDRLPGAFRAPLVLCYFEGLTLDEAAHRLRWPAGTLRSRLARAREKLRRRLTRTGFAPAAPALAAARALDPASGPISSVLCDTTAQAGIRFAAGHAASDFLSAPAIALAREVLSAMIGHKLKLTALSLLVLGAVATGLGWLTRPLALGDEPIRAQAPFQQPVAAKGEGAVLSPIRARMTVNGRVLGPDGKPVAAASVMVYGASRQGGDILRASSTTPAALGQAICDGSGRFRLEMPRISSATHYMVCAAALAPGYGVGWVDLDVDDDLPAADVTLRPEQVIEGRLFDITGQSADGVRVSVGAIGHPARGPEALPDEVDGGPRFWGGDDPNVPPAWPKPVITGADGRFTLRGIGRGSRVFLLAVGSRFARQRIIVDMDAAAATASITGVMEPAKVIIGRVTLADTGQPVAHAAISIWAYRGGPAYPSDYETDADGNFRANPYSTERYAVSVQAPPGQPYLSAGSGIFDWIKGASERRVDFVLHRGVALRGKIVEAGSGRPVEGAALGYVIRDSEKGVPATRAHTGPDGTYQFAVLPKAGTLAIMGPSDDYIFQEMDDRMLREGRPGGKRQYAHAFVSCDLKPGTESREINVVLNRGATVKARVTTPDGQPVVRAWIFSRLLLRPEPWATRRYSGEFHGDVRNGHGELHGLPPEAEVPVYFLDSKNQLGATATFSVKAAVEVPIPVQLAPCGIATARLVDSKGLPIIGYRDPYLISMIVTPGRDVLSKDAAEQDLPSSDGDYLSRVDPDHYNNLISDAQGRITFPALIPGATYRVNDMTTVDEAGGRKTRSVFIAKGGESLELGDIVIEKPQEH